MKRADLARWAVSAGAGKSVVYHQGLLAADCELGFGADTQHTQNLNRALRSTAQALASVGMVRLVQRRISDGVYDYIAERTGAPAPLPVAEAAAAIRDPG
jgi:hypothetical protein